MDLIIAVCRALANSARLCLLRDIHRKPGKTVQALARDLGLSVTATSKHLKLLRSLHLIQTTPSGRFVRCSPPHNGSTSNAFLCDIQKLIADLFRMED